MGSLFENVQLRRDTRLVQRQIECRAVFGRHPRVGAGAEQKRRRSLWGDAKLIRKVSPQFGIGILAQQGHQGSVVRVRSSEGYDRVRQDHEIRPRAYTVDRVSGPRITVIKMSRGS